MVRETLASAPEWLVPRGLPTEDLVAHSMVSKFGDYLPFYRQADIYRRQGVDLDRSMLANWSGRAAQLLDPIIDHMVLLLKRSDRLQMDETNVPVLAPGTGKVRKDYLWVILRDQRGWSGCDPPIVFGPALEPVARSALTPPLPKPQRQGRPEPPEGVFRWHADGRRIYRLRQSGRPEADATAMGYCLLLDALATALREVQPGYAVADLY
jgi:transposase